LACGERGAARFCHEINAKLDEFPAATAKILEMKPILALITACAALAACQTDEPLQQSRALPPERPAQIGITGRLLDNGRPVAGTQVRITSANRPSHTIATTTDEGGRFYLSADDTGPASPDGDILRIEVLGQDYHAAGEVSPASLQVTCDLAARTAYTLGNDKHFWDGNDTQASLSPVPRGLKCW
jgi:hypothetical protein